MGLKDKGSRLFVVELPVKDMIQDPGTGKENLTGKPVGSLKVKVGVIEIRRQRPPKLVEAIGDKAEEEDVDKGAVMGIDFRNEE